MKTFISSRLFGIQLVLSVSLMFVLQIHAQTGAKSTYVFSDTLSMDIYSSSMETKELQPLFLYVHGGGFQSGSKDVKAYSTFVSKLLENGFLFASMEYDLTLKGKSFSCDQSVEIKIETILDACRDISKATAFLIENQHQLSIDTNKIILAGSSAGAEAALHAAYWHECSKNILPESFRYAGVISMAGAILDSKWITKDNAIPSLLFHGSCDPLVPFATAPHHYCSAIEPGYMILHGPLTLAHRLVELNMPYYLMTECGAGHEWHDKAMRIHPQIIMDWIEIDVLNEQFRQIHHVLRENKHSCKDFVTLEVCE